MKLRKLAFPALALLIALSGCHGSLSTSFRRNLASEHEALQRTASEWQAARGTIARDLLANPALFNGASAPAAWNAALQSAQDALRTAQDTDRKLSELAARDRAESEAEAERLLIKERTLRVTAANETRSVLAGADKWLGFRQHLSDNLPRMQHDYDALRAADFATLSATIERAGHDWPAKKEDLNKRLATVQQVPRQARTTWEASADARSNANAEIGGAALATLIETSDTLAADRQALESGSRELSALAGQLYDSWDKILIDLDSAGHGRDPVYRERIRTVRSHVSNPESKETETSSSEQWVDVSGAAFQTVANDLGMAISHKDLGLYDAEATTQAEPAGFAYIAPESQVSNQYGHWTHENGQSVWAWLPQYLILRELLWNHAYHPVGLEEYRGYRVAEHAGRTYYGTPAHTGPPQYGTHGSFTRTSYASSRYVQAGDFGGSAYSSRAGSSHSSNMRSAPTEHASQPSMERGGKRFGSGVGAPSGHRFGSRPGRSFGRGFGRRR